MVSALVLADRSAAALAPLDRLCALPLLPVAGKELILFTVEELIAAGVRDCTFVVSDQADRAEALLGDGQRWGARFRIALSRGDEAPSTLWSRVRLSTEVPVLVLRADLLRSPVVGEFLALAQARPSACVLGAAADPRASLLLLKPGCALDATCLHPLLDLLGAAVGGDSDALDAGLAIAGEAAAQAGVDQVALPDGDLCLMDSLADYHRANLDLVRRRFRRLIPAGRELAAGLIAGRRAEVQPRSLVDGWAYVGDNSRVDSGAELRGAVVIGRDVLVDRGAKVADSVILPQSYVGEQIALSNAIIAGNTLIRVDTGVVLTITDAFLLSRLSRPGPARPTTIGGRAFGLLLLVLSLPLWLLALVACVLAPNRTVVVDQPSAQEVDPGARAPRRFWLRERLLGNPLASPAAGNPGTERQRIFSSGRFATCVPVLAVLPRLLAVVRGRLRLIGVAPLTPEESALCVEHWQRVREEAPVGLLGPTQLLLAADASLDERLMSDAFYVGQRGAWKDLRWLWVGLLRLFNRRAWVCAPSPAPVAVSHDDGAAAPGAAGRSRVQLRVTKGPVAVPGPLGQRRRYHLRLKLMQRLWPVAHLFADVLSRALDLVIAMLVLLLLSPLLLGRELLSWLQTRQLFETEERIGRLRRPFHLLSFAGHGPLRGLAAWINVLRGDLAVVGPRPLTPSEALTVPVPDQVRFLVRPGLISVFGVRSRVGIAHLHESALDREFVYGQTMKGDLGLAARSIVTAVLGSDKGANQPSPAVLNFFGVPIVNTTMAEALSWMVTAADAAREQGSCAQMAFVNPDCLNLAWRNAQYRQVLCDADRVLPDGIGLHIGCRMRGQALRENINGTDLFPLLCEAIAGTGRSLFLLGARPGVAEAAAGQMQRRFADLEIAGTRDGYFDAAEEPAVIEAINASGADMLLVAMGAPRQDLWIASNRSRLRVGIAFGVGGLLDFYSGRIPRAPIWLRELGLEWGYRLLQEPGRMWRRYVIGNPVFLWRVWLQARDPERFPLPDSVRGRLS